MGHIPVTATIITHNEANHIAECVRSVQCFDEVLVVDSGSTDNTVQIAEAAGARVIPNDWPGFGAQKQFAAAHARNDWIFSLDADERLTPTLASSIQSAVANAGGTTGFYVNRRNHFMGRPLRHGEGYPDWCLRLFHRDRAHWTDEPVHEKVQTDGQTARLTSGELKHYSEDTLADYIAKQNLYTSLQADAMFAAGRTAGPVRLFLSPLTRFLKFYFLRLGCLDGIPGLIHISIGCFASFSKYAKLRELHARAPCPD